ncbi:MAG TPA: DMT family transporter [Candidatus Saccharimonadales bacterium]|nr:DMT family transporter [Candidatus Saccharimonadales bacterium]
MNHILAAVLSNLSYALADNGNGLAAKKNSSLKVAVWAVIYGIAIFFIPMILFFGHEIARLNLANILWILGTGSILALGYLCFVTAMSKGSVTLTGVIGGSFPAVTTLTALLFFGERVTASQAFAIAVIFIGVALSSLEGSIKTLDRDIKSLSLLYALGAFFLWGIYFAVVRIPVERVGWFLPQYGSSIIGLPIFLLIAKYSGQKNVLRQPKLPALIAVVSILQISGSMFFNYAITQGDTAIVAPIAGSSPAVFVILAYFVFKERIKPIQTVGIVAAVAGIVGL